MDTQENTKQSAAAAEVPQPAPQLAPEKVVEQLRTLRGQIGEVKSLTPQQRRGLTRKRTPGHIVHASISVIGALDTVAQAIGQPADEVRQLVDELDRWTTVEDEMRAVLNGVSGANLVRRQRIEFLVAQAGVIGSRLALDPANEVLVSHVQEVKRLKRVSRRKKTATPPETPPSPAPGTPPTPPSGPSGGAKT